MKQTRISEAVMQGGLNLATPPLSLEPGEAIQLYNYEVNNLGRYRRLSGYQRYDGTVRLHEISYFTVGVPDAALFDLDTVAVVDAAGENIQGIVTARDTTLNILAIVWLDSATSFVVVVDGATITQASSGASALTTTETILNSSVNSEFDRVSWRATQDYYRATIDPVPGEGPLRGVAMYKGDVYAFRDNVGQTACNLYKSSGASWVSVTTPALDPGGKYKFEIANFTGSAGTFVLLGVDGVNPAFQYDGTTFTQLTTTLTPDTPVALAVLPSKVLILGFETGSLIGSAIGDPTDFTVASGGFEIAVADEVRDLKVQPNKALAIFCKTPLQILYGSSPDNFELTTFSEQLSAKRNSVQALGDSVFLSDSGVRRLSRSDQYGDFQDEDLSIKVKPLLDRYGGRVESSFSVKSKNQYRICFDDGNGVIIRFVGNEVIGSSTFNYGKVVRCAYSGSNQSGEEEIYFGSDDGYVYQAEVNRNFDGASVFAICRPAFNFINQPERRKRFKKAVIEIDSPRRSQIMISPELDYSGPDAPAGNVQHTDLNTIALGGGGYFDEALWNEVYWSTAAVWLAEIYLSGVGRNISLVILSDADDEQPHTVNSMLVHWSGRVRQR